MAYHKLNSQKMDLCMPVPETHKKILVHLNQGIRVLKYYLELKIHFYCLIHLQRPITYF